MQGRKRAAQAPPTADTTFRRREIDVTNTSTTLRDFYEQTYRPARHAGERHRRSRAEARTQVNNFNRWWHEWCAQRDRPLAEVPLSLFDDFGDDSVTLAMAWLVDEGRERSPATANKLRATINAIWRLAAERGLVTRWPNNRRYRTDLEDPIALAPEEKAAVIAQAQRVRGNVGDAPAGDWWLMLVLLLLNSGARIRVMRHARTAGLDVARGELLLPARYQKQHRDQRLALWPSTRRQIARVGVVERGLECLLDDWPYTVDTLRRHYTQKILEPAGLPTGPKHKFHCLRKTLGSEVAQADGVGTAQSILGHSSPSVTLRYIDPRYEHRPRVPELVADPLPSGPAAPLRVVRDEAS